MKVIYSSKATGKTTELIKLAFKNNAYIVCADRNRVDNVWSMAGDLKLKIPFPMTFSDLLEHRYFGKGVGKIMIDDADDLIASISRDLEVVAITITKQK